MRVLPLAFGLWLAVVPVLAAATEPAGEAAPAAETLAGSAKTPAEQRAVAEYFRTKASDARRDANVHHQMELSYSHWATAQEMAKHCRALIALDKEMAREYEALAAAHAAEAEK